MTAGRVSRRTLALAGVMLPLLGAFVYVVLRLGPLAPVPVTVVSVESRAVTPGLFGIGTVEARYTHRIGPTLAGRILRVDVEVGERVRSGQVLGEMDPVDFDERLAAQSAARARAEAALAAAEAQVEEAAARREFAQAQVNRYEQLREAGSASVEAVEALRLDLRLAAAAQATARANVEVARRERERLVAEHAVLVRQREHLRLVSPSAGLVTARLAEAGTTLVAGQPVLEMIDPESLWLHVRFDQLGTSGLRAGLPARIVLRSQPGVGHKGRVLRVEPVADAVTEETLAKVVFAPAPAVVPPIGELVEVTVLLAPLPPAPSVPVTSVQRVGERLGVWELAGAGLRFRAVELGARDLDGWVQIASGVGPGTEVVVHSLRTLGPRTRVQPVEHLPGVYP